MLTCVNVQLYLEDQTDSLVRSIQSLVGSIRNGAKVGQIRTHISTIAKVVGDVVNATEEALPTSPSLRGQVEPIVRNLAKGRSRMMTAGAESEGLKDKAQTKEFMSKLPPLAFEIARETKELVQKIDSADQEQLQGQDGDYL
jgi:G protein-coupled receptor kinase-interacting protein 1 C term